jgi:FMN-dependent NADH-azoreductase
MMEWLHLQLTEAAMKNILQINSSLSSAAGESTKLADLYVKGLLAAHPQAELTVRDLAREVVPHLDAERFGAFLSPAEKRNARQNEIIQYSNALIEELQRAEVIVLGVPMYNFGVPSQLKAWFDHVARAGVTFKYTAAGAIGLLAGKKAIVIATRGGRYGGTEHEIPYVRQFLGFLGITDVDCVVAEGLAISETSKNESLAAAQGVIRARTAQEKIAA